MATAVDSEATNPFAVRRATRSQAPAIHLPSYHFEQSPFKVARDATRAAGASRLRQAHVVKDDEVDEEEDEILLSPNKRRPLSPSFEANVARPIAPLSFDNGNGENAAPLSKSVSLAEREGSSSFVSQTLTKPPETPLRTIPHLDLTRVSSPAKSTPASRAQLNFLRSSSSTRPTPSRLPAPLSRSDSAESIDEVDMLTPRPAKVQDVEPLLRGDSDPILNARLSQMEVTPPEDELSNAIGAASEHPTPGAASQSTSSAFSFAPHATPRSPFVRSLVLPDYTPFELMSPLTPLPKTPAPAPSILPSVASTPCPTGESSKTPIFQRTLSGEKRTLDAMQAQHTPSPPRPTAQRTPFAPPASKLPRLSSVFSLSSTPRKSPTKQPIAGPSQNTFPSSKPTSTHGKPVGAKDRKKRTGMTLQKSVVTRAAALREKRLLRKTPSTTHLKPAPLASEDVPPVPAVSLVVSEVKPVGSILPTSSTEPEKVSDDVPMEQSNQDNDTFVSAGPLHVSSPKQLDSRADDVSMEQLSDQPESAVSEKPSSEPPSRSVTFKVPPPPPTRVPRPTQKRAVSFASPAAPPRSAANNSGVFIPVNLSPIKGGGVPSRKVKTVGETPPPALLNLSRALSRLNNSRPSMGRPSTSLGFTRPSASLGFASRVPSAPARPTPFGGPIERSRLPRSASAMDDGEETEREEEPESEIGKGSSMFSAFSRDAVSLAQEEPVEDVFVPLVRSPESSDGVKKARRASLSTFSFTQALHSSNERQESSTTSRSASQSGGPRPLEGCVVFVDVRSADGIPSTDVFTQVLKGLGAKVIVKRPTQNCTHIVFKSGLPSTVNRYRLLEDPKPLVVSATWVRDCAERRERVDESQYFIDLAESGVAGVKRRKTLLPRHFNLQDDCDEGDSKDSSMSVDDDDTSAELALAPLERARQRTMIFANNTGNKS